MAAGPGRRAAGRGRGGGRAGARGGGRGPGGGGARGGGRRLRGPGLYLPLECAERDRIRTPGCDPLRKLRSTGSRRAAAGHCGSCSSRAGTVRAARTRPGAMQRERAAGTGAGAVDRERAARTGAGAVDRERGRRRGLASCTGSARSGAVYRERAAWTGAGVVHRERAAWTGRGACWQRGSGTTGRRRSGSSCPLTGQEGMSGGHGLPRAAASRVAWLDSTTPTATRADRSHSPLYSPCSGYVEP